MSTLDNKTLGCVCCCAAIVVIGVVLYYHYKSVQNYTAPSMNANIRSRNGGFTGSVDYTMKKMLGAEQRPAAVLFWNDKDADYYVVKYWNDVMLHVEQTFPVDTLNVKCNSAIAPFCNKTPKIVYFPNGYTAKTHINEGIVYMGIFEEHAISTFVSQLYGQSLYPTQQ